MRSIRLFCAAVFVSSLAFTAVPCAAQGAFGIGGRMSMVRTDAHAETDALRFFGGQIRARLSAKTAVELSLDRRTETNDALTVRVRDMPIQASLLLFPVAGAFSPYILGGGGWYSHRVEALLNDDVLASDTTRDFGWHGGIGAELRMGRHAGLHADYRYTFLKFGGDEDKILGKSYLPGYTGSMWTAGATVYF